MASEEMTDIESLYQRPVSRWTPFWRLICADTDGRGGFVGDVRVPLAIDVDRRAAKRCVGQESA
jgi:hypothetical protein